MLIPKDSPPTYNLRMEEPPFLQATCSPITALSPPARLPQESPVVILEMFAALSSISRWRYPGHCWAARRCSPAGKAYIPLPLSWKITLYLGDSPRTADSVGDFSAIKLGQPGPKEPPQGPVGKTQQDIAQLMRTGHFFPP